MFSLLNVIFVHWPECVATGPPGLLVLFIHATCCPFASCSRRNAFSIADTFALHVRLAWTTPLISLIGITAVSLATELCVLHWGSFAQRMLNKHIAPCGMAFYYSLYSPRSLGETITLWVALTTLWLFASFKAFAAVSRHPIAWQFCNCIVW